MTYLAGNTRDDLVAQLDEVWTALAELGAGLDDAEWRRPTSCPGWDVAAQYAHVIGTESMLLGRPSPEVEAPAEPPAHVLNPIGGFNEVWVEHLAPQSRPDVLAAFAEVTEARRRVLAEMTEADFAAPARTPIGQADYRRFMQIRIFDCWVHEQDSRTATDHPGHGAGPVVEQSLDEIVRALGYVVGKKAGVAQGSAVRFELTGDAPRRVDVDVAERAQVVDVLDRPPTVTLTLPSTLFARLACGRVAPADATAEVAVSGDSELGWCVIEHLAFTI
jgi:uncharacterized protein (TIGR03083 family)